MQNKFLDNLGKLTTQITDAEVAEYGARLSSKVPSWFKSLGPLHPELQKLYLLTVRLSEKHRLAKSLMSDADKKDQNKVTALDMMAADSIDASRFFEGTTRAEYDGNPNIGIGHGWEIFDMGPACTACNARHSEEGASMIHARMGIGPIRLASSISEALAFKHFVPPQHLDGLFKGQGFRFVMILGSHSSAGHGH